ARVVAQPRPQLQPRPQAQPPLRVMRMVVRAEVAFPAATVAMRPRRRPAAMRLPPASLRQGLLVPVRPMALLARPMPLQTLRNWGRARPLHKRPSMAVLAPGLHWQRARRTHLLDKLSRHRLPRL